MDQVPVDPADVVIEQYFFKAVALLQSFDLPDDVVGAAKADIPAGLHLPDPVIGAEGAVERAAPAGHDPDLGKPPIADHFLMITQFPVHEGQAVQILDKGPRGVLEDAAVVLDPEILDPADIVSCFQCPGQVQHGIFPLPDAEGIQPGGLFQTLGVDGRVRAPQDDERVRALHGLDHFPDELKLGGRSIDPDELRFYTIQVLLPLFQVIRVRIITEMNVIISLLLQIGGDGHQAMGSAQGPEFLINFG